MKKHKPKLGVVVVALILISCTSVAFFSLESTENDKKVENEMIKGSLDIGHGFFFPSVSDRVDLVLYRTDLNTNSYFEMSRQTIRNVQKLPLNFILRYDGSEVLPNHSYSIYAAFVSGDYEYSQTKEIDILRGENQIKLVLD